MEKKIKSIFGILLSVTCALSCMLSSGVTVGAETNSILSSMTLEQKIGQMITVDVTQWNGEDFTIMEDEVSNIISENNIGGVVLFAENITDTEQTVALTTSFQNAALSSATKIPLFIGIDQEGGEVVRLAMGTSLPGNMALGAINSVSDAENAGNILGGELSALGINVDYAPSLDVNSNPQNPIIGLRSFSSNPQIVSNLGSGVIKGIQGNNVIASAKHFPGHGDTSTDSHTSLPIVNKTLEQLQNCEFIPFKNAIANNVDMIMTAHIQFPQIEKTTVQSELDGSEITLPATLSKTFVTDILRNQLKYNGVVTTDAMNMSAISENFGTSQACILAINAGVDELLMPVSLTSVESGQELANLISDIKSAVENGTIKEDTINSAVKRILDLKEKRGILNYKAPTVENAKSIVGSQNNHEIEDNISTKAITVLKNDNDILPFKAEQGQKVVFITAYSNETPNCEYAITKLMAQDKFPNMDYEVYCYNEVDDIDTIIEGVKTANYVVLMTEMNSIGDLNQESTNTYIPRTILNYTTENNIKCVVVSIGKPYDVANYTDATALLAAYGCNGMNYEDTDGSQPATYTYGPNIIAAIEVIFGYKTPYGMLPVDVPMINADGTMDTNKFAFKTGAGLLYKGTERQQENVTPPATENTTIVNKDTEASTINSNIIKQFESTGDLIPIVCLFVAAIIVVIILFVVITRSSKEKKSKTEQPENNKDSEK